MHVGTDAARMATCQPMHVEIYITGRNRQMRTRMGSME